MSVRAFSVRDYSFRLCVIRTPRLPTLQPFLLPSHRSTKFPTLLVTMDDGSAGFFKVLLDDFWEKLKIPTKFVRTVIKEQEWQSVKLESPLGKIWSVEVQKDSNGFHYFGEGWREFVEAHGLRFGYFLVFTYGGNMGFLVTVFDHSECRKWYGPIAKNENVIIDDEVDVKDCKVSEKPKEEPVTYSQRQMVDSVGRCPKAKEKSHFAVFKTTQFKVTINPCNLLSKEYLRIPNSFLVSNDLSGIRQATLSNSNGHWSVKLYHHRSGNRMRSQFGYGWCSFWSKNNLEAGDVCVFDLLSKDKNKVHFFVSKEQELPWKEDTSNVSRGNISHKMDGRDSIVTRVVSNSDAMTEAVKQETKCVLGNKTSQSPPLKRPCFEITIKKRHLSGRNPYLHIPVTFGASHYLSSKAEVTLIDHDRKSWKVNVCFCRQKNQIYHRLGKGWLDFCHDKMLKDGDVCTFELISEGKKAEMIINVQKKQVLQSKENNFQIIGDNRIEDIIDVEDYETLSDVGSRKEVNEDYSTAYNNSNCKRKVSQADWSLISQKRSEISNRPEFIVRLKHNHLFNMSSYLCIPSKFEGSKFLSGKHKAILEDVKGKSWHVNLYENRKSKNGFQIGAGWHSCATDNRLEVGDVCSFKLMSKKDIVMRFEVLSKEINK